MAKGTGEAWGDSAGYKATGPSASGPKWHLTVISDGGSSGLNCGSSEFFLLAKLTAFPGFSQHLKSVLNAL